DSAWGRLSDEERMAYRRLSVFRGGFTQEAVREVTGASLATLATLVNRALVWRESQSERYQVHELLRQYAEEQLQVAGEAEMTRTAYRIFYAQYAYQWSRAIQTAMHLTALNKL